MNMKQWKKTKPNYWRWNHNLYTHWGIFSLKDSQIKRFLFFNTKQTEETGPEEPEPEPEAEPEPEPEPEPEAEPEPEQETEVTENEPNATNEEEEAAPENPEQVRVNMIAISFS